MRSVIAVALGLSASVAVNSSETSHGDHSADAAMSENDEATVEAARADYPMTTCVVSGDELGGGDMKVIEYLHKEEGKPDRLVRFCCKDCVRDFRKDSAEYLAKIDAAAAKKAAAEMDDAKPGAHSGHQH